MWSGVERWGRRAAVLAALVGMNAAVSAKDLHILVVGQSISANCNEHIHGPVRGVEQVGLDGQVKPAADPLEWADCGKGSVWLPLGRSLIEAGMADRVVFMSIGVAGTSVADWQEGGRAWDKLQRAMKVARGRELHFDYAFWQQGSSDARTPRDDYRSALSKVLSSISAQVRIDHWLVAQHSSCFGQTATQITDAQREIGKSHVLRRYVGADLNSIGPQYRTDGCHLNQAGQEKAAQLWMNALRAAERDAERFEKEALLHYFQWEWPQWLKPSPGGQASAATARREAQASLQPTLGRRDGAPRLLPVDWGLQRH